MQISVKLEGLPEIKKYIESVQKKIEDGLARAIAKGAYLIEGEGKTRTPVDTGRLRASIFTQIYAGGMSASVMPLTNYAIYVHEDLTARHRTGEAKFMENALKAKAEEIGQIFDEEIANAIK